MRRIVFDARLTKLVPLKCYDLFPTVTKLFQLFRLGAFRFQLAPTYRGRGLSYKRSKLEICKAARTMDR